MTRYELLSYTPMLCLLCWAAAEDLRCRRIPNWLSLGLAVSGLVLSFTPYLPITPGGALLGLAAAFVPSFILFGLGARGGGDVKLLSAIGVWLGAWPVLKILVLATLIEMLIVLVQALMQGKIRSLLRNTTVVALSLAHARQVGMSHAHETAQSCASLDRPLPYAVPLLLSTLLLLFISFAG